VDEVAARPHQRLSKNQIPAPQDSIAGISQSKFVPTVANDLRRKMRGWMRSTGALSKFRVNTSGFTGDFSLKKEKIGASNHTSNRRLDLVERHAAHHETKAFCLNTGAFAV
jgi:hypothetical protein